jgi:hypothetical protein
MIIWPRHPWGHFYGGIQKMTWNEIVTEIIFDGPSLIRVWDENENDYIINKPWIEMTYNEREHVYEMEVKYIYSIIDQTANGPQAVTIIELAEV